MNSIRKVSLATIACLTILSGRSAGAQTSLGKPSLPASPTVIVSPPPLSAKPTIPANNFKTGVAEPVPPPGFKSNVAEPPASGEQKDREVCFPVHSFSGGKSAGPLFLCGQLKASEDEASDECLLGCLEDVAEGNYQSNLPPAELCGQICEASLK